MDDVDQTGWGAPDHLWVLRHVRIEVVTPAIEDDHVQLTTWCSGTAAVAAGRRMSLSGDRGGRVEIESAWIHLGPDARPARIVDFGLYADAAGDRAASTRLELPVPRSDGTGAPWPLRVTDVDVLGHVNNAAYWHAVEQRLLASGLDPLRPMRARLDHRHAIDLQDDLELVEVVEPGRLGIGFTVEGVVSAVAWVEERS